MGSEMCIRDRPKSGPDGIDWSGNEDVHAFWLVKRVSDRDKDANLGNCELIHTEVGRMVAADFTSLQAAGVKTPEPCVTAYKVAIPCIVNTPFIDPGKEVVLKVAAVKEDKDDKKTKAKTAFDQLKQKQIDAKKRRLA